MATQAIPAGEQVPTADQRLVTYAVSWDRYEAQLAWRGDASSPRLAYLEGALELMSPSRDHERIKSKGGEFSMPPTDVTASKIAMLNDTVGNIIQLVQLNRG